MGCDIHGWVEVKMFGWWFPVVRISSIISRNYDMFGCLFGVRNYAGFEPIAEGRGIPDDVSDLVKEEIKEWGIDGHSHTWITWKEIKEIDWNEECLTEDDRIHVYDAKTSQYLYKFSWSSELTDKDMEILMENKELKKNGKIYRLEKMKRKDALTDDWKLLFKIMEILAEKYGDENVRLVVWFDN